MTGLRKTAAIAGFLLLLIQTATGRDFYPRIPRLSSLDPVFAQFSDDVRLARRALASGTSAEHLPLAIYSYKATAEDSLLSIAARCAIPYDAIATLNRLSSTQQSLEGKIILLPTVPGLYLPDTPHSALERLLLSSFDPDTPQVISFTIRDPEPRIVHCLPDVLFDGTVRAFFLNPSWRFPLPTGVLTSSFGMRRNPLTGNLVFHNGVDIAAPAGTPVFAAADGTVLVRASDPIYGNYIILRHDGGRETLYGHLRSWLVELHQQVKSGSIIGEVGSTGQSTGPHLHFEIHEHGVPKNPAGFIRGN